MEDVTREFIGGVILLAAASVEALRFSIGLIKAKNGSSSDPDERYAFYVEKMGEMETKLDESKSILIEQSGAIKENTRVLRKLEDAFFGKEGFSNEITRIKEWIKSHEKFHNGKK